MIESRDLVPGAEVTIELELVDGRNAVGHPRASEREEHRHQA